jgi:hypothetical protein
MADIAAAMQYFHEPELFEIAENVLGKLSAMTDAEFAGIIFTPAYNDDDDESEV